MTMHVYAIHTLTARHLGLITLGLIWCTSCKNSQSSFKRQEGVTEGSIISSGQPESIFDRRLGRFIPASLQEVKLNTETSLDLRLEDTTRVAQPTLDLDIDPRQFTVSGVYMPGLGQLTRDPLSFKIAVPAQSNKKEHAPCPYPFKAPGQAAPSTITVDGKLSDWPKESVVIIDPSGDGFPEDLDIREVYFARDDSNIFLGIQLQDSWLTTPSDSRSLEIYFEQKNSNQNSTIKLTVDGLLLCGNEYRLQTTTGPALTCNLGQPMPWSLAAVDYQLAIEGSSLELRISRNYIENHGVGSTYSIRLETPEVFIQSDPPRTHSTADTTGSHLVGVVNDYACMVPLPNKDAVFDRSMLLVFHRAQDTISAESAERQYRALIAAAQSVDFVQHDHIEGILTIPVVIGGNFQFYRNSQIYFAESDSQATPEALFNQAALSWLEFYTNHDYNFTPSNNGGINWLLPSYRQWAQWQTIQSYFGITAAQLSRAQTFANVRSLDLTEDGEIRYLPKYNLTEKGAAYLALVGRQVRLEDFANKILGKARETWDIRDKNEFIQLIKERTDYQIGEEFDLNSGWLEGDYPTSGTLALLLGDNDGDGLVGYQETDLKTSDTDPDSDDDGIGDGAESMLGLSPTSAQGLHALVPDNYLGDWDLLLPGKLAGDDDVLRSTNCGESRLLRRFGAVVANGWVLLAAELYDLPDDDDSITVIFRLTYDNHQAYVRSDWAGFPDGYFSSSTNNYLDLKLEPIIPFTQQTLEVAVRTDRLTWTDGNIPDDLQISLEIHQKLADDQYCYEYTDIKPESI